jgi:hypothetical protein
MKEIALPLLANGLRANLAAAAVWWWGGHEASGVEGGEVEARGAALEHELSHGAPARRGPQDAPAVVPGREVRPAQVAHLPHHR